jgi:hypothetical protein
MDGDLGRVVRTLCAGTLTGQLEPSGSWATAIVPAVTPLLPLAANPDTDGVGLCRGVLKV